MALTQPDASAWCHIGRFTDVLTHLHGYSCCLIDPTACRAVRVPVSRYFEVRRFSEESMTAGNDIMQLMRCSMFS